MRACSSNQLDVVLKGVDRPATAAVEGKQPQCDGARHWRLDTVLLCCEMGSRLRQYSMDSSHHFSDGSLSCRKQRHDSIQHCFFPACFHCLPPH